MINLQREKNPMPEQAPDVRNKNFLEVTLGYTEEQAINEALRCVKCRKKPCMDGCPVMVKIPEFVAKVAEGEFEEAYQIISETSSLPAICGRVCPQENQCEGVCARGVKGMPVAIGRLERFVADWHAANYGDEEIKPAKGNGHKVAIVGAGPAGLACAGDLINKGYEVTVFESLHKTGGVLVYGIPQFRLPKEIVAAEVAKLEAKGVKFETDAIVGRAITVDELIKEEKFESVFIGTGAGLPSFMNIPGENLLGVVSANEYLTRINLMKAYKDEYDTPIMHPKRIAVVGGGNVAMDAARCAKRMGAEAVYVIYRRSAEEIPARAEELHHAIEEGIIFHYLTNPVQVLGDDKGNVTGIECVKMELGAPDASGRRRPIEIEGSNFVEDVDYVIMSIGTKL
ncbi:MAG: NADPH-dependent glutamate synthase, partial [Clostridiales bacterium]|nr:NADPH-dependent glutamate synthase [Clostridiales bacterium]